MIRNIKLFVNNNENSMKVAKLVKDKFSSNGFIINEDQFDLAIAIGGDGSFLRMVRNNNFNENIYYVGVNAGHLGYLQEVKEDTIDKFIGVLKREEYTKSNMSIQETVVNHINGEDKLYSINEVIVKPKEEPETEGLLVAHVYINNEQLETFRGDGIMIVTPIGSTGHCLSAGGCIIDPDLEVQEFLPMNPIFSNAYHSLRAPMIVADKKPIKIYPEDRNIKLVVDGKPISFEKVGDVTTTVMKKKIKTLHFNNYNFVKKVKEKFL